MIFTWLFDFDETVFSMSNPPKGVSVEAAYDRAVIKIFGPGLLSTFRSQFGLGDRPPSDIVRRLSPESSPAEVQRLAKLLVDEKLSHLLGQIGSTGDGTMWPTPCQGFLPFWRRMSELREGGVVQTGVVSPTSHTAFIERVWQAYDLKLPDVIISADDIPAVMPQDSGGFKGPRPLPLALARNRLSGLGNKANSVYCGKNLMRDGGDAAKANVRHGLFVPDQEILFSPNGFQFPDWAWVARHLPYIPGFLPAR